MKMLLISFSTEAHLSLLDESDFELKVRSVMENIYKPSTAVCDILPISIDNCIQRLKLDSIFS